MASTSGKRCTLSIEQKLKILEALKSKKVDDVAKHFNIGYSTVKKLRQNEEEVGIVDKPMPGVSLKDVMHLSMVRKYLEENFTEYNSYYDIEEMIEKNALINRTQKIDGATSRVKFRVSANFHRARVRVWKFCQRARAVLGHENLKIPGTGSGTGSKIPRPDGL
ncbi:unnamed protein product [Rotaria magnacalcarata]|uniref:Uncharacterized protein n=1 Tax=Rotaria magnacalcarata TaxID=392030 RepID=A0A816N2F8_9BILA|nr:unnamed protein product [Rotaria magnacalcarata]